MQCLLSKRPEFVVVYGRRWVGKTYLIREYFNQQFSFYTTGLSDEKTKGQLRAFQASLNAYGYEEKSDIDISGADICHRYFANGVCIGDWRIQRLPTGCT